MYLFCLKNVWELNRHNWVGTVRSLHDDMPYCLCPHIHFFWSVTTKKYISHLHSDIVEYWSSLCVFTFGVGSIFSISISSVCRVGKDEGVVTRFLHHHERRISSPSLTSYLICCRLQPGGHRVGGGERVHGGPHLLGHVDGRAAGGRVRHVDLGGGRGLDLGRLGRGRGAAWRQENCRDQARVLEAAARWVVTSSINIHCC